MIHYAPVLPAEQWTSIDRYCENYERSVSRYASGLTVNSLLPDSSREMNKWKKRLVRDVKYPARIKKVTDGVGLVHVFDHAYAHLCKSAPKSILHCHDLNHFVEPSLTGIHLNRWKKRVAGMKHADRIIAISEQLSSEIQQYIGIPEEKISVVYNGLDHETFAPQPLEVAAKAFPEVAELRETHFLILNVGTNLERKNLETLYGAVRRLKDSKVPVKLIRVGTNASREGESARIDSFGITDEVVQMGVISSGGVASLYNLCHALSFPSLYEGFGWPLVEAQACGLPLVAANNSCIPEIAGNGALFHDPLSSKSLASQLMAVYKKKAEVLEKRQLGLDNVKRFSWEKHVEELQSIYQLFI